MTASLPQATPSARPGTAGYTAAVVHDFTEPLRSSRSRTGARAGEILVRVEASGLCHTDIHAAHGDWPVKPTPPFVPGHEGVGIVEQLGAGSRRARRPRRDAWLGYACGACDHCIGGLGDALRAAELGLLGQRRLRRVRRRVGCFVAPVPDGVGPSTRRR